MAVIESQMASDAVLVADTGYAAAWAGALAEVRSPAATSSAPTGRSAGRSRPRSERSSRSPTGRSICIIGDGGFGYHIGDIETALRLELPVIVVILNNQTLAFEAHVQTLLYGKDGLRGQRLLDVDYGQVARAFGAKGIRVTNAAEFRQAFAQGLERQGRRSSTRSSTARRSRR